MIIRDSSQAFEAWLTKSSPALHLQGGKCQQFCQLGFPRSFPNLNINRQSVDSPFSQAAETPFPSRFSLAQFGSQLGTHINQVLQQVFLYFVWSLAWFSLD